MYLSRYGKRNKKIFQNFGKWQKTLARKWITVVSYNCLIHLFYTTFLVLFYVLILQKVTAKGLRKKRAKNRRKMVQKPLKNRPCLWGHKSITAYKLWPYSSLGCPHPAGFLCRKFASG
jgi:hypothetical protein